MKIGEIIKSLMKVEKVTQIDMMKELNMNSQAAVSGRLTYKTMSIENAIEMLDVLDYELVVQPKNHDKEVQTRYIVTKE